MTTSLDLLNIPPLERLSVSDRIAETLRDAIVDGVLPVGEILRQDEIAARFAVSKIPVREALKRLEAEGLVTFIRNRGALVASLSSEEIMEYLDIRAMLEARAAELAAPRISEANLAAANAALDALGQATEARHWGELNWQLHSALYADAGRPILMAEIRALYDKVERYVRALLAMTPEMPKTQAEHRAIVAAFARRDGRAAAELTRAHVLDAGTSLVKYLKDHRDH
ncbi:GntR family transcriptional regulator [Dechloromonas sp. ZY10]|uniref:GntR family transcriptional regulator n=1 Tax=Dechloromonas aquae TaxID=2664436 RepID=UPI00352747FC